MKILAIIPARGGSKSIPLKNIRKLDGMPLVAHTIRSAKKAKKINRIIVSTDSEKIAEIAKKYGAEIPFLRPKKFARDDSSTLDVVRHALQFLEENENYVPDIVTILLPTSPFRPPNLIDKTINTLKNTNATSVVSVHSAKLHPFKGFTFEKNFLKPFIRDHLKYYQRQKLPPLYHTTGAAYTFWNSTLKKYGHYYGPRMIPIISDDDKTNIDVDYIFDFFVAEMTSKYWKKYAVKLRKS